MARFKFTVHLTRCHSAGNILTCTYCLLYIPWPVCPDKLPSCSVYVNPLQAGISHVHYNYLIASNCRGREINKAVIQQPKLECRSCIFNELMVRSDITKGQTSPGYLVLLKATNEMNKCFGLWSKQQRWQYSAYSSDCGGRDCDL